MELFRLNGVKKIYQGRTVVDIPDLSLESHKIYTILGPNGAGKTTLLRLLNLLATPEFGKIYFMGQDISKSPRLEMARQMCMVFQKPIMFRTTVYKNVAYGLKLRGLPSDKIDGRVREALSFVGIPHLINRLGNKLSGGEIQRVALARALVLRPRVLFLDEPTANLDPASVQVIEETIKNSKETYGNSVIMVTHNLFQARRLADEAILMFDGKITEKQATSGFFDQPLQERTRSFLNGTLIY